MKQPGNKASVNSGHRSFLQRLSAQRAVEKIEAAMKRKGHVDISQSRG